MGIYLVVFVGVLLMAVAGTPLARKLGLRMHAVDQPDPSRKVHTIPTPRLGGVAIFLSTLIAALLLGEKYKVDQLASILVGASLVSFMGLIDDRYTLSAGVKLLGQIFAAVLLIVSGVTVGTLHHFWLDRAVTLVWLVGITNAFNLLDNMDGLSAGVAAICAAGLLGAAGAILIQAPAALKIYQGLEKASVEAPHPPVAPAIREGGHVFFASAVSKSVEIVDRVFASLIGTGAISSLYFSFRLVHLPFSVLSLALSRSLAPEFSRLRGQEDTDGFAGLVHFGIGINLIVLTPIVLFLMVFSAEVVGLFYGRGAFGSGAISRTSWAYLFYAPAILPMGLIALLNRVHASLEDNRLPLLAAVVGAVLNIGLDALLWNTPLQQGGIALASSLGLSVQTLVLLFRLGPASRGMLKKTGILLLRLLVPLLILAAILLSLRNLMGPGTSFTGRLWRLALGVLAGAFLYVPPAWRLRPSMEHTRPETPLS